MWQCGLNKRTAPWQIGGNGNGSIFAPVAGSWEGGEKRKKRSWNIKSTIY